MAENSISWSGYEHEHREKTRDWYWALGIIALSSAVTALLFKNVLFAVLIVVAAFTLAIVGSRRPKVVEFELNDKGLKTGDTFHVYAEIKAFWVEEDIYPEPTLLVDTLRFMTPHLMIPLTGVDADSVRTHLAAHVREEFLREPLSHRILEFLGF